VHRTGKVERMSDKRIKSSVARVISRFEDLKTRVEQSYQESGDFRSLCEDYAVCERALEKWQACDAFVAAQRRQEYSELLAELGQEIKDWLEQRYVHDQSNKEIELGDPQTP
jgi:hypothetical protein